MRVKVMKRLPRLAGPAVNCPSAGQANFEPIARNLDATSPSVTFDPDGHITPFGFTLSDGETEIFDVTAAARSAHVDYYLLFNTSIGGRSGVITVMDHGRPFQATGSTSDSTWSWNYENGWQSSISGVTLPVGEPLR
jgi:hypothetical protein